MTNSLSFFGITFHVYGLIVGLAIWLAVFLIEKKAVSKKVVPREFSSRFFWQIWGGSLVVGVIGARLWHVLTDFYLYYDYLVAGYWWSVLEVWHGGLSILGGVLGGLIGATLVVWQREKNLKKIFFIMDVAVFGLPFGQAVGRFANYVNQELYGLPTILPWKIFINPENRLPDFNNVSYYHPLFLYESILMLVFGIIIWKFDKNHQNVFGKGRYFVSYIMYYSVVRFFLDFLRIDKVGVVGVLGINQIILLLLIIIMLGGVFWKKNHE